MKIMLWAGGAFLLVIVGFLIYAYTIMRHLFQQKRAEEELADVLSRDAEFRESMGMLAECVYRYGSVPPGALARVGAVIVDRTKRLSADARPVLDALGQPSVQGRHGYIMKLMQQALSKMVDIPFSELELRPSDFAASDFASSEVGMFSDEVRDDWKR